MKTFFCFILLVCTPLCLLAQYIRPFTGKEWKAQFENIEVLPAILIGNENVTDVEVYGSCHFDVGKNIVILASLPNLTRLKLSFCNLEEIPASIQKLQHLKSLDVENNNISRIAPEIGELKNLKYLNLSQQFNFSLGTSLTLSHLKNCQSLQHLDLAGIGLKKVPRFVQQLEKLSTLNIDSNTVKKLPAFVHQLKTLKTLTIKQTDILHAKNEFFFKDFTDFTYYPYNVWKIPYFKRKDVTDSLFLRYHSLSFTEPARDFQQERKVLKNFEQVDAVILHQQPNHLFLDKVKKCTNAKLIHISEPKRKSYIKVLKSVPNKDKVEEISITQARMTKLPKVIYQFKNLRRLYVVNNPLQSIDDEITQLSKLESIGFDNEYCGNVKITNKIRYRSHLQGIEIER